MEPRGGAREHGRRPGTPCVVCGDRSSGRHYGQLTCEGCKSFFKRSIRRNLNYVCRGGKRCCPIDRKRRNQCPSCRLMKCIEVGMRREAVQWSRLFTTGNQSELARYRNSRTMMAFSDSASFGCSAPYFAPSISTGHLVGGPAPRFSSFISMLLYAEHHQLQLPPSSALMEETERERRGGGREGGGTGGTGGGGQGLGGLIESASRLLFGVVEWARSVQVFSDLQVTDQVALLRLHWSELFVLGAAQSLGAFLLHAAPLLVAADAMQSSSSAPDGRGVLTVDLDQMRFFQEQVERLRSLQMDPAEYGCLKAIVLFSSEKMKSTSSRKRSFFDGSRGAFLSDPTYVECLQERSRRALEGYVRRQYPTCPYRFGRLMLQLSALRVIPPQLIESMFFVRLVGRTPIETLVGEMLVSGSAPSGRVTGSWNPTIDANDTNWGVGP